MRSHKPLVVFFIFNVLFVFITIGFVEAKYIKKTVCDFSAESVNSDSIDDYCYDVDEKENIVIFRRMNSSVEIYDSSGVKRNSFKIDLERADISGMKIFSRDGYIFVFRNTPSCKTYIFDYDGNLLAQPIFKKGLADQVSFLNGRVFSALDGEVYFEMTGIYNEPKKCIYDYFEEKRVKLFPRYEYSPNIPPYEDLPLSRYIILSEKGSANATEAFYGNYYYHRSVTVDNDGSVFALFVSDFILDSSLPYFKPQLTKWETIKFSHDLKIEYVWKDFFYIVHEKTSNVYKIELSENNKYQLNKWEYIR